MRLEGLDNASETAQAKALFRWLRLFSRMATGGMIQAYEGDYGKEQYVLDNHKNLFVYGWGYCDTSSRIAEGAWVEYKNDQRAAERVCVQHEDGGYHTMYRLRLDGRYGAFDPRYGYYLVERDHLEARILDWDEVGDDDNIRKNKTYRHRSRPFFEYFGREWDRAFLINPGFYDTEDAWRKAGAPIEYVFGDPKYEKGTALHDMDFRLLKGMTIERYWDNSARKFYVPAGKHAQREEPFLPSGRFYRVTETMLDGNWPKHDPNYEKAKPYLVTVPTNEGYKDEVAGGRTIGQAWGRIKYEWDPSEPLDLYSPYILVGGTLSGELPGDNRIEIRTLRAKAGHRLEPDVWSSWERLHRGAGKFAVPLGRERFNGKSVSTHGVYRFQLRAAPPGPSRLKLEAFFETGIMSIPQIFAGRNTIRFKVRDAARIAGPIRVVYRYRDAAGEQRHEQTLRASDFRGNVASYTIDAPGLIRCDSVSVAH